MICGLLWRIRNWKWSHRAMDNLSAVSRPGKRWLYVAVLVFLFLWTFGHSFLGIDLVDTGYYFYQYLHPRAGNISYSGYLATLIGAVWLRVFHPLGLWGLNLLELLLEYSLCGIVFLTFRKTFRAGSLLAALVFCMLAISTYVNVFNYHQLSMFFCTSMLCAMFTGLRTERPAWQLLSGACGMLAMFSRFPCVLCLICLLCIVYWRLMVTRSITRMILEMILFLLGFALMMAAVGLLLYELGVLQRVIDDVFRLSNLGNSGGASYGVDNQALNLIKDTVHSAEAALLFLISGAFLGAGFYLLCRYIQRGYHSAGRVWGTVIGFFAAVSVSLFGCYFAMFRVGRAPGYVQLTSFSWFLYGMLFLTGAIAAIAGVTVCFLEIRRKRADNSDSVWHERQFQVSRDGALAFMGIALVLLCFVGSAARAKHCILGMWFLVPLAVDRLWDFISSDTKSIRGRSVTGPWPQLMACSMAIVFLIGFGWFLVNTNNFDDTNLTLLTHEIHTSRTRFLKTTQRESEAVNQVLDALGPYADPSGSMMVIGNPVMLYALTDMPAYVRPWVTGSSYLESEFQKELAAAEMSGTPLPVVVFSKTNPYLGFSKADYEKQLSDVRKANEKSSKVQMVIGFMEKYAYGRYFENAYFEVWLPGV